MFMHRHIIFSDGELAVHPLRMVRIDNIFQVSLGQTQALAADLRIDISYFPMVNQQSIRYTNGTDRRSVLPSVAKISQNERFVCMRQYWTTI
jgi:hypothetical protein